MNDAENALNQITALSKSDPDPNRHIDKPKEYYRQYLAILINGKKVLFLNALCSTDENARKRLVFMHDGGKCFWHAMYDPATRTYSDLTVNGTKTNLFPV